MRKLRENWDEHVEQGRVARARSAAKQRYYRTRIILLRVFCVGIVLLSSIHTVFVAVSGGVLEFSRRSSSYAATWDANPIRFGLIGFMHLLAWSALAAFLYAVIGLRLFEKRYTAEDR